MANEIAASIAALGIAIAPAVLKFAEAPQSADVEIDEEAEVACVIQDKAPVHARYKSTGTEARLSEGDVVQVLSKRKEWRHIAYVLDGAAELGWITTKYVGECDEDAPTEETEPRTDVEGEGDGEGEAEADAGSPASSTSRGLKIASFNIQNLGKTKMAKDNVVTKLVSIVRRYPLVAVQELSDKASEVPGQFLERVNGANGSYKVLTSERSGVQPDDVKSQEQYAFYFDDKVVEAKSQGELYDDTQDFFQREPYVARFQVRASAFNFVIITIHTAPGDLGEIEHLDDVVTWARAKFPGEDDFIILGDFNAGCSYASPEQLDELAIRHPDHYTWLVPDSADTNLAPKPCAYDRVVVTPSTAKRFLRWGVDRAFDDKTVSDHWPIWAEFRR